MKKNQTTSVILADDHVLLRDALANLINAFDDFRIIGTADNGEALLSLIQHQVPPDLLLLDLNMPTMDGYEAARQVQKKFPAVKMIILTMYDSEIALIRLLQIGVRGFLKKDIHPAELKIALKAVVEDGYYYTNTATGKIASFFYKSHQNHVPMDRNLLSEIEIQFLKYASTDMTYKEIAMHMRLTPRTIDSYRDGLFEKLDVKSRVGLAIYSVKNGIVTF